MSIQNMKQDKKIDVFVDDSGIINIVHLGAGKNSEEKIAIIEDLSAKVLKILKEDKSKSYNVLVDLTPLGDKQPFFPAGARNIAALLMGDKQIKKWAVASPTRVIKVTLNFVSALAGKDDTRWFENKEDALKWLKEE